jgi:hypothetical protein
MSTTRHIALGLVLLAALALAGERGAAGTTPPPDEMVTALTSDRDAGDGRPPTTGPTNPTGYRAPT